MIWGRFFWTTMHVAALGFPDVATDAIRQQYKDFYIGIGNALPCAKCKANYARHLSELPIDLYLFDKNSMFAWTVKFHNIVSKETGKNREWTIEEAKTFYTTGKYAAGKNDCTMDPHMKMMVILNIALMLGIVVAIVYVVKTR